MLVVKDVEDSKREFFRLVRMTERLVGQGFPKIVRAELHSDCITLFASGNAYPIPLIIAGIHKMLALLATFDLVNWPLADVLCATLPVCLHLIKDLVYKQGKIVSKLKADKAKLKKKEAESDKRRQLRRSGSFYDSD